MGGCEQWTVAAAAAAAPDASLGGGGPLRGGAAGQAHSLLPPCFRTPRITKLLYCCTALSRTILPYHAVLPQVPAERVLVLFDDLDLPTAAVRLRAKGGHGGHNGMRSIAGVAAGAVWAGGRVGGWVRGRLATGGC